MNTLQCQTDTNQETLKEGLKVQPKKETKEDEYPVIWYEPDIDSEKKKTFKASIQENREINLFSKFEEAFKIAQSLGSFLLITPMEVEEEKLFQDFRALKDTHGRRYFDFEEVAVLKSLFKEISEERIKSLKVHLFCTREDFLKELPVNEQEDEVVVKCDIKKMAEQFPEEFTIIWCDPDVRPENKEALVNKLDIEEKNIYTDFEDLLKKLYDYNGLPYHLILSGKTKTELLINHIDDFKDLLCVYIYGGPPLIVHGKKARRIKTEKTLEGLIPRIIESVRTSLKHKNTFPAFATQFDDWDKSHNNKVHFYLRGLRNFKNRRQAKGDFIHLAKRIYQSKKLLEFEKEYAEYNKEQILKWYAAESPIYKLVNNCLRIATSDSITYCRFLLNDLETAIRENYQQQNKRFYGVVYRGAYISKDEFEKLERNIGKEIEMYGFLSTSTNKNIAESFVCGDIKNKVFITIIIPPISSQNLDEQGFANLRSFSEFSEEEILFNVRSRFQVLEVGSLQLGKNNKDCRHLVLLYGAQLLRQHMTRESPTISLIFQLPLELKCCYCESKNNLFASTEKKEKAQVICRECFYSNNFASKTTFLLPIDEKVELDEERRINIEVKGTMLELGTEAKLAWVKTDKCRQCSKVGEGFFKSINMENKNPLLDCLECFKKSQGWKVNGLLLFEGQSEVFWSNKQEKWEQIDMDWKAEEFEKLEDDFGVETFGKAQDYRQGQELCRKFLQNSIIKMGRERLKVENYSELGISSEKLGDHREALEYHQKAFEIRKFIYGESHLDTANSYKNLALVCYSLGEHKKAIEYNQKALDIRKFINGESHPHTATSYDNLALVYKNLGEYQKALEYHLKALEIRKFIFGESHPKTATSYNNLAMVYDSLGEHQKAIEYHQKALDIRKSINGASHSHTATSYDNLAIVYHNLGEYQKALGYHLKALAIRKSIFGESHPRIATSYNNLASVYDELGKYQEAIHYYLKAYEIRKSHYKESHQDIANSHNNLASMYFRFGEHQKALEHFSKSLEIHKFIYGEFHLSTAVSHNNLAMVYDKLGEYQKALKYHQKALEIRKSKCGESHSDTASSYNNLGVVFYNLGEYQKALAYHRKALEIWKFHHGEFHPLIAHSYNKLALVFQSLGEHQKALDYCLEALNIQKSNWGESHPEMATSYKILAEVWFSFKDYTKAHEYLSKALDLKRFIFEETHPEVAAIHKKQIAIYIMSEEDDKDKKYLFMIPGVGRVISSDQIGLKLKSLIETKVNENLPSLALQTSIQVESPLEKIEDSKAKNLLEKRGLISDLLKKIEASEALGKGNLPSNKDEENVEPDIQNKSE